MSLNADEYCKHDSVVVTGSELANADWFDDHYRPLIDKAMRGNALIRVGSAAHGIDFFTRQLLRSTLYDNHIVYVPVDSLRDFVESESPGNSAVIVVQGDACERDRQMCDGATHVIAKLSQYGAATGEAWQNVLRVVHKIDPAALAETNRCVCVDYLPQLADTTMKLELISIATTTEKK